MLLAAGRLTEYWRLAVLSPDPHPDLLNAAIGHLEFALGSATGSEEDRARIAGDLGTCFFGRKEYLRACGYLVQARKLSTSFPLRYCALDFDDIG
jgi:hypothetical protein